MRANWPVAVGLPVLTGIWLCVTPVVAQPASPDPCVDVRIGSEQSYACLNRQLQQAMPRQRFSSGDAPISAASPGLATGTFNSAATQEQLGRNFGVSARPQRPLAPVFPAPLIPH